MVDRVVRVVLTGNAASLIAASNAAATALGRLGTAGTSSSRSVASSSQQISRSARDVGSSFHSMGGSASAGFGKLVGFGAGALAIVGGLNTLKSAVASTFKIGMDFQSTINNLGAVTGSTGAVLEKVSVKARQLGSDIDLPAASASDAAAAMLELAKGGLSVQQSMDAAKGTLTLAAAAQIDGASAATIQSAALNTFGLSADKAGHVADVLANTANAASGSITDFAAGMQQSGSVAAAFGISLDSTATVLGLFAKNGIIGSDAGTSFKTMLTQLAAPTKVAKLAMEDLGLSVYDANGNFVGAEELTNQLAKAQGRLSQQQFNTAATTVFGSDALRGANILAKEGVKGYDAMAGSVSKVGGAQVVATAQTKGLKGALGLVKNAVQDVQLNAFDKMAPSVEKAARGLASAIPGIAAVVLPVFGHIVDQVTQFFGQVGDVAKGFGPENVSAVLQGAASIGNAVTSAFQNAFTPETLHIVGNFAGSVLKDLISLGTSIVSAASSFFAPIVAGAAQLVEKAQPYVEKFIGIVKGTVKELAPLGKSIGDLFSTLASNGTLDTLGSALNGFATGIKNLAGGVVPAIGGLLHAFGGLGPVVDTAGVALGAMLLFRGPLIGMFGQIQARAAAAAVSLAASSGIAGAAGAAAGGLSRVAGVLGGPWGLAIGVGVTALFSWLSSSKDATRATVDFSAALDANTGNLTANAAGVVADKVKDAEKAYIAAGGAVGDYTSAILGNIPAQTRVVAKFAELEQKQVNGTGEWKKYGAAFATIGITTADVATAFATGGDAVDGLRTKLVDNSGALSTLGIDVQDADSALTRLGDSVAGTGKRYADYTGNVGDFKAAQATATAVAHNAAKANDQNAASVDKLTGAVTRGSGGVSGLGLAGEAAAIQLSNTGKAVSYVGDSALAIQKSAADAGLALKTIGAKAPAAAAGSTAVADALKNVADAANLADQNGQFFLLTMQRIGGKNISAEQAANANAAAIRGIGGALRDQAQAEQNVADKRAALKAAQDKVTGAADPGLAAAEARLKAAHAVQDSENAKTTARQKAFDDARVASAQAAYDKISAKSSADTYTDAQKVKDIAAATRDLAGALDSQKDSTAGVTDQQAKAQSSAALTVSSILQQEVKTKGFTVATNDAKKALAAQRVAFIEQVSTLGGTVVATNAAKAAAGKLADQYGLVPKTVDTVINADPALAAVKVKAFNADAAAATKARTAKFTADTKDALGTIGRYGQYLAGFPKAVKSKFNADIVTAEKSGQRLYRVYDATKRTWTAQFETPTAAAAQVAAKRTVQQYDRARGTWSATFATPNQAAAKGIAIGVVTEYNKARGTWTANLLALDKASKPINDAKAALDSIKNKVVTLEVRQSGTSGEIVYKAPSGQQFQASGGFISGAGTGTSDSIPAWLSNGEYVVKATQTAKNRPLLEAINSGAEGFATGGMVGSLGRRQIDMIATGANPGMTAASAVSSLYKSADAAVSAAKAAAVAAAAAAEAARASASGSASGQDPSAFGWQVGKNIVPFSFQGIQFPSGVAGGTESIWSSFLSELAPIIPGGIRPGEDWGYENRDNVNSPGKKSFHAYGLALDVNSSENPNMPGTSGPAGSGMYQIPSAAGALAHKYNMEWGADWGDAMHFELHQPPAGFAAASASAGVGAGAQSGSGVERWRALATKVARAKGEDLSSVQVMLNQMDRESSGNPRAINLTDINAQRGTPSVGLLQFIPGTFAANADPGYNTDIYDPESQMRAWYHYINGNYGGYQKFGQRGYGAYADGGLVRGAGSGRSDSNLARVSNGEYIVNAASTSRHLPLLHSINGYANGGVVGSSTGLNLAGRSPVQVGPELSNVVAALADIAQAVRDARDAVAGQRDAEVAAFSVLNAAKRLQYENQTAARNLLKAARDKQGTENAKTSARERLVDRQKVTAAERVLSRTVAADRAAVGKADREYRNARRTALSYEAAARAAEKFQASQQRAYRAQQQHAAQLDALTDRLGSASEKLNGLRSDRASLASGLASSVSGFDGGITGHNDTRNTFATILKGQQYNAAQAQKFNVDITKLRALGLSNGSLNSIASAGVDGGGVTAAALAKASPKQIAQLNGTVDQMRRIGINVGNVVGGAFYDAGIQAAAGLVKGIQSQMAAIQKVMNSVAGAVVAALVRRLQIRSPSKVMEGHGFNTVQGYINGITGSTAGVTKAIENMVAVPPLANMTAVRNMATPGTGAPSFNVRVFVGNQEITDIARVEVDRGMADLERSLDKVGSQA